MTPADAHADVARLLPWYVNGTLSAAERERVERHVHECLSCYSALQQERQLSASVRTRSAASISAEQGFDRLMARIDGSRRARGGGALARAGAPAVAAAGVAALAAVVLVWLGVAGIGAGSYETAARGEGRPGPLLDVVFAESVSAAERRALLDELGATVVAGPSDIGRYTVRVDTASASDALQTVIERLRDDERVRFAGRSYSDGRDP